MTDLKKGMLVQHATLGVGKIVALDQKALHVFFARSQDRFATKLRRDIAQPFLSATTTADGWLSGLSAFLFDERSARYKLTDPWMSDDDAVARFLELFPAGFDDVKYTRGEGTARDRSVRWRRAHKAFTELLGGGEAERLLASDDVSTLVDRAHQIERHVRPLLSPAEKALLSEALSDPGAARGYFEALAALLAAPAPDEARFEALAVAVAALPPTGAPDSRWVLATLLPFVAQPERHALLRPRVTCDAAARLRLELAYRPEPNWTTYAALLRCSSELLEKLSPLGARDNVDLEAFMHVATTKHTRRKQPQATLAE